MLRRTLSVFMTIAAAWRVVAVSRWPMILEARSHLVWLITTWTSLLLVLEMPRVRWKWYQYASKILCTTMMDIRMNLCKPKVDS